MNQEPTFYAGIGSRETPQHVLDLMEAIAFRLARGGHVLRSGAAGGADAAFERGCDKANGLKQIFIPWEGFQGRRAALYHQDNIQVGTFAGVSTAAMQMASTVHPNWNACSRGARALHARNCYQVLGPGLDWPVSDVICWTPNASGSGGTGQAIRLAKRHKIPVWDLGDPAILKRFTTLVGSS